MLISYVIREIPVNTWSTTTYQLEWLESETPTIPGAAEDVEPWKVSRTAGGSAHGSATLEDSFAASLKLKLD